MVLFQYLEMDIYTAGQLEYYDRIDESVFAYKGRFACLDKLAFEKSELPLVDHALA
jgi:hypothetical protein